MIRILTSLQKMLLTTSGKTRKETISKKEDIEFVNHLKNNQYILIGLKDKKYEKRTVIREAKRGQKTSQEQSLKEVC